MLPELESTETIADWSDLGGSGGDTVFCVFPCLCRTPFYPVTYRQQIPSSMDLRQEQVAYPTSQPLAHSIFSVAANGEIPK